MLKYIGMHIIYINSGTHNINVFHSIGGSPGQGGVGSGFRVNVDLFRFKATPSGN